MFHHYSRLHNQNDNVSAVDCVWNTWEDWPACPSGCPVGGGLQEKTRTRSKAVAAACNGIDCAGPDFEKEHCSREEELLEMLQVCKKEEDDLADAITECKVAKKTTTTPSTTTTTINYQEGD